MLVEQPSIGGLSPAVHAGVSPPPEQIASLAVASARAAGGLLRRGRVVDDPDLVHLGAREGDQVVNGVIGDRVRMEPVRVAHTLELGVGGASTSLSTDPVASSPTCTSGSTSQSLSSS